MKRRTFFLLAAVFGYLAVITCLYYVESAGSDPNIRTLFDAFWYSLVTLTTVGYGDYYPTTITGKILSFTLVAASLGVLGCFIGKLTEHIQTAAERRRMGLNGTDFTNHVVIVGWNDFSEGVVTQLVNAGKKACVITDTKAHIDIIHDRFPRRQVFTLYSEFGCRECLIKANAARAVSLMPCLGDDTRNLIFILNAKKDYPDLSFVVTLDNAELKETFINAGVSFTISRNEVASKIVASYTFEPSVARFNEDLLASASQKDDYDILQYYITEDSPFADKLYGEVFTTLQTTCGTLAIGISRDTGQSRALFKLPDNTMRVLAGDYILVMTSGGSLEQLTELFGCPEGLYEHDT
ncbi:potassium channel family protein [Desulfoplanes sp.]